MGFVWRVLKRHGVPDRELEDGCQEVFLVVHRRRAEFEGRSTLRTWLYGIAVRVALALRRKAHVRGEQLVSEPPEAEADAPQECALQHRQTLSWLQQVLQELDELKREAFVLYELEGMSVAELAVATGVPENRRCIACTRRATRCSALRRPSGAAAFPTMSYAWPSVSA